MRKFTRREIVKGMAGSLATCATVNLLPLPVKAQSGIGGCIVAFFKYGGADGMNIIAPVAGDISTQIRTVNRPTVALPINNTTTFQALRDDQLNRYPDEFALHFGFQPLLNVLAANGNGFRIQTCVGDTSHRASRSHSEATVNMQTLRLGSVGSTPGLIARAAMASNTPQLGFISLDGASTFVSGARPISLDSINGFNWANLSHGSYDCGPNCPDGDRTVSAADDRVLAQKTLQRITSLRQQANPVSLQYRNARELIDDSIVTVRGVLNKSSIGNYGNSGLGNRCRDLFRMIWFTMTDPVLRPFVKYFTIGVGGWDMHSNVLPGLAQAVPAVGQAMAGLAQDLINENLWSRTCVIQSSEFGRTSFQNESAGVDHAEASNFWLTGGCLRPGRSGGLFSLTEAANNNAFKPAWDSRAAYYAAMKYFGVNPAAIFSSGEWDTNQGEQMLSEAFV